MRLWRLSFVLVLLSIAYSSQASILNPRPALTQEPDVSHSIPPDLSFAIDFVKTLSESGFSIQAVRHSIFNGGTMGTKKAAWIRTDQGVLEVLFFDRKADVEQIAIKENENSTPNYHRYTVTTGNEEHPWEGRLPVYFTKYRSMLIITYDNKLNAQINRLFAENAR